MNSENLILDAQGCDILIYEVYSAELLNIRPLKWKKNHQKIHISTIRLDLQRIIFSSKI
jgi:hypothetical protein